MSRNNECFDEEIIENMQYDITKEPIGLIALFYRNLWAMADLRERLKEYEDLDEHGRLVKLPCKVGNVVYYVCDNRVMSSEVLSVKYHAEAENHGVFIRERLTVDFEGIPAEIDFDTIGKTVFLTKSEAEAKLKELRGGENEN